MENGPSQVTYLKSIQDKVGQIRDILDSSLASVQMDRFQTRAQNQIGDGSGGIMSTFTSAVETSSGSYYVFRGAESVYGYLGRVLGVVDNTEINTWHNRFNLVGKHRASQAASKATEALGYFPLEDLKQINEGLGSVLEQDLNGSVQYWTSVLQGTIRLLDRESEGEMTGEQLNETEALRESMNLLEAITLKFIQKYTPD